MAYIVLRNNSETFKHSRNFMVVVLILAWRYWISKSIFRIQREFSTTSITADLFQISQSRENLSSRIFLGMVSNVLDNSWSWTLQRGSLLSESIWFAFTASRCIDATALQAILHRFTIPVRIKMRSQARSMSSTSVNKVVRTASDEPPASPKFSDAPRWRGSALALGQN